MTIWNLKDVFDGKDPKVEINRVVKKSKRFSRWKSKLANISYDDFTKLLKEYESLQVDASHISSFIHLSFSENTSDTKALALVGVLSQAGVQIADNTRFFEDWFKHLPDKKAKSLSKDRNDISYYLDSVRKLKPFTLDSKIESTIATKDATGISTLLNIYNSITNDFQYKVKVGKTTKSLGREQLTRLVKSPSATQRRTAYDALYAKFGENQAVLSQVYQSVAQDWTSENVKLRGFKSPISVRNMHNDLPDKAIQNLLDVCKERRGVFQKYFRKKAKFLKIKNFSRYDIYAQAKAPTKKISWNEAKQIVLENFEDASPRMYALAKKVIDEQHIHSTIVKGKRTGAFCLSPSPEVTPYVLLSYNQNLEEVSTLAHELGHAVHGLMASKHSVFGFHPPLPLAETASIFSETLLIRKLLKNASKKDRQALLLDHLDKLYASIGRQAYFVLFEQQAHDMISKGASASDLNKAYLNNLKEQFGSSAIVPDVFQYEWLAIPHIFESPFYCYAYAFGNLLSLAFVTLLDKQGPSAMKKIERVFEWGGAKEPTKILKEAGFNINSKKLWEDGFDLVEKLVSDL